MSNARLEDLLRQRRELDKEVVAVRKQRQSVQVALRRKERNWRLTGHVLDVLLAIYALSDCAAEPAIAYLQAVAREYHWPELSTSELTMRIETLFVNADINRLASEGTFSRLGFASAGIPTPPPAKQVWCSPTWFGKRSGLQRQFSKIQCIVTEVIVLEVVSAFLVEVLVAALWGNSHFVIATCCHVLNQFAGA